MTGWAAVAVAAGMMAWAVRGRSSAFFGPSIYRGDPSRRAVALTFDDGPSEGTPAILEILDRHQVKATFFQCGANVLRLPAIARQVASAGHEIGNHSHTHSPMYLKPANFVLQEFGRAQNAILEVTGVRPAFLRAPYGARWFGFAEAQRQLHLTGVMWTVLGRDWKRSGDEVAETILRRTVNGAILCLHDGRELQRSPGIAATIEAVRLVVPALRDQGYQFETLTQLICPKN
jgi:peptidoglycan/xylan/chitin deacetylase (PgdA/CDA1 family)